MTKHDRPPAQEQAPKQSEDSRSLREKPERFYLVPFPSFIFLYPTFAVSLVAAVVLWWNERSEVGPDDSLAVGLTAVFLGVLAVNLIVLVFDFPRATSLIIFFLISTLGLGVWLTFTFNPELLPRLRDLLGTVRPAANATFFICFSLIMAVLYVLILISVQFNYWELRANELLHHHGILSDLKRYPAPNLRVDKEIKDVFEYFLLKSGRLVLHPSTEKRAIVLDNILFVSRKEKELTRLLASIKVQVRKEV